MIHTDRTVGRIAIITLLMGILMPALQRVKKHAYQAICTNNLRQTGLGGYMCAESNDQFVPRGLITKETEPWFVLFMSHLSQKPVDDDYRSVEIYRCPAYPDKDQAVCYVINSWGFSSESNMIDREYSNPTKLSKLSRHAEILYLVDNSSYPEIVVDIQASFTILVGAGYLPRLGDGTINPVSIQPDM